MNEKFFELKREKQERIINAALEVFSKDKYRYASTDKIVELAGISKGLLFHYFGSKMGVFSFLYDYSVRYIELELYGTISIKETNYFELLCQVEETHALIREKHFYMLPFLNKAEAEEDPEIQQMILKKSESLRTRYQEIFEKADMSFLNRYSNKEQIQSIIRYAVIGFDREFEADPRATSEVWAKKKPQMIRALEKLFT